MEIRVALDTNRLIDFSEAMRRSHGGWKPATKSGFRLWFWAKSKRDSTVVPKQRSNEILLNKLLTKPTVEVLLPARETAEQYARLFVQLKQAGTPVPDNDLWIAALALQHQLTLITRDKHFERVPQLLRAYA